MYIGDYRVGDTLYFTFNTVDNVGTPITLAGTPSLAVYKAANVTQDTSGITLSVDFDSVTGLHRVTIDLSSDGTFYATANDFVVVIAAGTVNSISVVGYAVAEFSIENRSALRPTTAGRELDVTATGAAGIDWSNVENPTTTVNLSATSVKTATDAETAIGTAQADLDILTGTDGATLATSQPNYAPAVAGDEMDLVDAPNATAVTALADGVLDDADAVETGLTIRGALRLVVAVLGGKRSGVGSSTEIFRNAVADSKARITATIDSSGNRTAITTDTT